MYRSTKPGGHFSDIANLSWSKDAVLAQAVRELALRSCKYHLKIPTKQGVSRTEIDTHSFKCVWGPNITGPCLTSQRRKTVGSPWARNTAGSSGTMG